MILPAANEADFADIFGDELRCGIGVHYARTMDDVIEVALQTSWGSGWNASGGSWEGRGPTLKIYQNQSVSRQVDLVRPVLSLDEFA